MDNSNSPFEGPDNGRQREYEMNNIEETKSQRTEYENKINNFDENYYNALKKENKDTKDYIGIIMKELEDTKRQLVALEDKKHKKKPGFWKGIAVFELLCLLGAGTFLGIKYIEMNFDQSSKPVSNQKDNLISKEENIKESLQTYRYIDNLESLVQNANVQTDFKLSVESLFGYEYLCYSKDMVKVYYRNEFDNEGLEGRYRIFIDNGSKLVEYNWDYALGDDLNSLSPIFGNYSKDGTSQLLFLEYPEEGSRLPSKLMMINADTLIEYPAFHLDNEINRLFTFEYGEEQNSQNKITNTLMNIQVNSAEYTYFIQKEQYIDAVYYDTPIMKYTDYADFVITEDAITLHAPVYISDNEYLGEITSKIGISDGVVTLQDFKYGAYVSADYEDPDNPGNITPRSNILGERVTLNGKENRRYLIPIFDNVKRNEKDWSNLLEEDGLKVYYENGVKKSIMGIDVSRYQGNIDWNKVKEAGVEYAIIRLGYRTFGEGKVELDPNYLKNIEGATKAGIPVGVYFFSQAITVEEALEEADMVLENIKDYPITYPVVFDSEVVTTYDARANHLSRRKRTDIIIAFLEKIKSSGYKPMIYANTKWMIMGVDLERLDKYDKWYAYYGSSLTFPYHFDMYQYSDQGKIPGIDGNVDLDISFIDYSVE